MSNLNTLNTFSTVMSHQPSDVKKPVYFGNALSEAYASEPNVFMVNDEAIDKLDLDLNKIQAKVVKNRQLALDEEQGRILNKLGLGTFLDKDCGDGFTHRDLLIALIYLIEKDEERVDNALKFNNTKKWGIFKRLNTQNTRLKTQFKPSDFKKVLSEIPYASIQTALRQLTWDGIFSEKYYIRHGVGEQYEYKLNVPKDALKQVLVNTQKS